jgi:hypothetical protein
VIQIVSSLCQRVADAERKTAMMQAKYKRKRCSLTRLNAECRNLIGSLREKKGVLENELQKQETEEERSVMKKVAELERLLEAKRAQEQTLGRTGRGREAICRRGRFTSARTVRRKRFSSGWERPSESDCISCPIKLPICSCRHWVPFTTAMRPAFGRKEPGATHMRDGGPES